VSAPTWRNDIGVAAEVTNRYSIVRIRDTRGEAPRGTEQGAAWVAERRAADADSTPTLYTTLHGADQAATAGGNDPCHEPADWPQAFKIDGANDATKQREESRNWDSTKRDTRRRAASRARRWTIAGVAAATVATVATIGRDARLAWRRARAMAGMMFGGLHGTMEGRRIRKPWPSASMRWSLAVGGCRCHCRATRQNRGHLQRRDQRSAPMHSQHMQARKQSLQLLTQPTIDRGQVEQLRVQEMQMGETASRRITQVILDAADVLTVAQRQQLVQNAAAASPCAGF